MRKYKLAVIGCGGVARLHAAAYGGHPERVEVVAACDPVIDRAERLATRLSGCRPFPSVADANVGADWDIGVVCSPTPFHLEVVEQLAGAGKHVFVEKPMADNLADARRMVEICGSAGVQIAVHQNFRYHYPFDVARSIIRSGRLGQVQIVAHRELLFRQDDGWRNSTARHSLAVMGIHWLDGFRWMLDDEPVSVLCALSSSPLIKARGDTDAVVQATLARRTTVGYVESFSSMDTALETNVIAEHGTLRLNHTEIREWGSNWGPDHRNPVLHRNPCGDDKPEATFLALDQLLQALDSNTEATNSGRDNLRTVAFLEAAYRSAELGRPVSPRSEPSAVVP